MQPSPQWPGGAPLFPPPVLNWALPGSRPGARTLKPLSFCCYHTRLFIPWMQPGRLAGYLQWGMGSKEGGPSLIGGRECGRCGLIFVLSQEISHSHNDPHLPPTLHYDSSPPTPHPRPRRERCSLDWHCPAQESASREQNLGSFSVFQSPHF